MRIGAQLYTVRDYMKNTDDFALTLSRIREIGYEIVQVSGSCDFEPEWLNEQLEKNSLKCVLTHTPADRILGDPEKVCRSHDAFNCCYVGLGWTSFNLSDPEDTPPSFYKRYISAVRKIKECGKYFMYHNHDQEFQKYDGRLVIEALADMFLPEEMGFTLDTFWITAAGGDPAQWIKNFCGRVPCIHLKDFAYGKKMSVIGEGNINFDRVFECAESSGTEYMLVEQDDCGGEDPFVCLKRSYEYLKSCGFN